MEHTGANLVKNLSSLSEVDAGKKFDARLAQPETIGAGVQNSWELPRQAQGTYAQQYLHAYNSRWMTKNYSAFSAVHARQSVMSRLQDTPVFLHGKNAGSIHE